MWPSAKKEGYLFSPFFVVAVVHYRCCRVLIHSFIHSFCSFGTFLLLLLLLLLLFHFYLSIYILLQCPPPSPIASRSFSFSPIQLHAPYSFGPIDISAKFQYQSSGCIFFHYAIQNSRIFVWKFIIIPRCGRSLASLNQRFQPRELLRITFPNPTQSFLILRKAAPFSTHGSTENTIFTTSSILIAFLPIQKRFALQQGYFTAFLHQPTISYHCT
jgi:hypothetical protein